MSALVQNTWSDIQDKLQPFDIIYFRGSDTVSEFIMFIEDITTGEDDWSHVGFVINRDVLPHVELLEVGKWYVWESVLSSTFVPGTDGVTDIETGRGYFGTQIRDLKKVISAYTNSTGRIGWGSLKNNPWTQEAERPRLRARFEHLHREYCYTPFNANPFNCFAAAFPCLRPVRNFFTDDLYQETRITIDNKFNNAINNEANKTDNEANKTDNEANNSDNKVNNKKSMLCLTCQVEPTARQTARFKHKHDTREVKVKSIPRLFCSEMIALFYIYIGVYHIDTDYRNVVPVDFYSNKDIDGLPAVTEEPIEFIPNK